MKEKSIAFQAFFHALGAVVYIGLVALLMNSAESIFGKVEGQALSIAAFLLLFSVSAAVLGMLVFGRPLMWYLDGKKKQGITLVLSTLGWLILLTIIVFAILIF